MTSNLYPFVVLVAAVGSGLMAGLFFVFSNFGMKALGSLPPQHGIAAMQSINVTIINPVFLIAFMGTAFCSGFAGIVGILQWSEAGMPWAVLGAVLYLGGGLAVTARFNVPLNNKLAAIDSSGPQSVEVWHDYLARWVPWNHVRTVATLSASVSFTIALAQLNRFA